ncbi:hypothetical protein EMPS_04496 [Entomortierella parvispora]|uniref:Uncharacterized protein n=1 Tax=Entomortierella parvispora TaxID=205924 RepID=A0A9P3H8S2_9FUNG|nr:hypothetical protein EMPS_04496 [Entomortierella parvispora]
MSRRFSSRIQTPQSDYPEFLSIIDDDPGLDPQPMAHPLPHNLPLPMYLLHFHPLVHSPPPIVLAPDSIDQDGAPSDEEPEAQGVYKVKESIGTEDDNQVESVSGTEDS